MSPVDKLCIGQKSCLTSYYSKEKQVIYVDVERHLYIKWHRQNYEHTMKVLCQHIYVYI